MNLHEKLLRYKDENFVIKITKKYILNLITEAYMRIRCKLLWITSPAIKFARFATRITQLSCWPQIVNEFNVL